MIKRSARLGIFFASIFILAFLAVRLSRTMWVSFHMDPNAVTQAGTALVLTGAIIGIYYLAKLGCDTSEGFWDVDLAAKCKGGPFFWENGDSELSAQCRALAETPEGRCQLSNYNCPTGYVGQPRMPFWYSPISDDNWKNTRCDDSSTLAGSALGSAASSGCPCVDDGLCRFTAVGKQSD